MSDSSGRYKKLAQYGNSSVVNGRISNKESATSLLGDCGHALSLDSCHAAGHSERRSNGRQDGDGRLHNEFPGLFLHSVVCFLSETIVFLLCRQPEATLRVF